jgi:hypothetical protein
MRQLRRAIVATALSLATMPPVRAQLAQPPAPPQQTNAGQDDIQVTGQRNQAWSKWIRAESPHFIVYGTREDQVREVAAKLERFDQFLRIVIPGPSPAPTKPLAVYLVFGSSQVERLRRWHAPPHHRASGYYSAAPTGILIAADMRLDTLSTKVPPYHEVWLFSEYCRHFLLEGARSEHLPAWYVDGLSLYFGTTQFVGDTIEYGRFEPHLAAQIEAERWESLAKIVAGEVDRDQLYSGESVLLVHYILADPARVRAFERFLVDVRNGARPVAAFEQAFGVRMSTLQDRLWQYRSEAQYRQATATGFAVANITVSQLPQSADTLLLDMAAMRIGIPEPDRQQEVLRRAENAVAERNDAFARRVLVQAQILYGAPEQADKELDALLASAPSDPELLYLEGMRHLMVGRRDPGLTRIEFGKARQWFVRAWQSDPDYVPALYAWAESLSVEPQFLSENTINVLLKAALLAPQATQIRVTAATMMMFDGRFEDAEALLAPILVSPRDPASEQIPALLAQAHARQRPDWAQLMGTFRYNATWTDLNCC